MTDDSAGGMEISNNFTLPPEKQPDQQAEPSSQS